MSVERYREYRAALSDTPSGPAVEYDWSGLPDRLNVIWMPYRMMLDEFSREIANGINQLTDYNCRLRTWHRIVSTLTDQEKLEVAHEFVDPIATVAVNLPFVIRSRFIFAAAHLCHQANRIQDGWRDDFPLDSDIQFDAADRYGAAWRRYGRFKLKLERIADRTFREATGDFRNAYNHRFSSRFVIGMTGTVLREVDPRTKQIFYSFGLRPPFELGVVADLLDAQCQRIVAAFRAFQILVREHEQSIVRNNPDPAGPP
jgi:hypothetical protein